MIIMGADYHPGFHQIGFVDRDTGEFQERRLQHREEAEKFYRDLAAQGVRVRVGMEARDRNAGLSDCSPRCTLSFGSEMQPRFDASGCASRRRIAMLRQLWQWDAATMKTRTPERHQLPPLQKAQMWGHPCKSLVF
jgi:hypothetical protein